MPATQPVPDERSGTQSHMHEMILAFLGPYAGWLMALSLAIVVVKRNAIRKRHIVVLLVLTVLSFVGFFALLVLGLARGHGHPQLFQAALFAVGAIVVACSSAIGFWFILKSFGLVRDADGTPLNYPVPPPPPR